MSNAREQTTAVHTQETTTIVFDCSTSILDLSTSLSLTKSCTTQMTLIIYCKRYSSVENEHRLLCSTFSYFLWHKSNMWDKKLNMFISFHIRCNFTLFLCNMDTDCEITWTGTMTISGQINHLTALRGYWLLVSDKDSFVDKTVTHWQKISVYFWYCCKSYSPSRSHRDKYVCLQKHNNDCMWMVPSYLFSTLTSVNIFFTSFPPGLSEEATFRNIEMTSMTSPV